MHICFLCNEYPPDPHGGIGTVTRTMAQSLAGRNHRVTVMGYTVTGQPGTSFDGDVRVIRLPHAAIRGTGIFVNGARLGRALLDLHARDPFDAIEGCENSFAMLPRRLQPLAIIRMHGGHHFFAVTLGRRPRAPRRWIERRSFARASHLCAVSRFVAAKTLELLDQEARPVQILPNPVDTSVFQPRESREEDGAILFAGTMCEKKGVRQLLQAMPAIVAAVPGAHLSLIGRDTINPETGTSYIESVSHGLSPQIRERVGYEGPLAHAAMPDRLARASVCVYPSHMEAHPLAWLEGMAMGKCVVASSAGPGPEVIDDNVSGLLCDPHNPDHIAARVIAALRQPALRRRLGAAARSQVVSHFSQAVMAARNEKFYESCRPVPCA